MELTSCATHPVCAPRTVEPPRRLPLYLRGTVSTCVTVDGDAILVKRHESAPLRYPFARISRVLSGARVEWTARAIAACLRRDIPIVFVDHAGHPHGYLNAIQRKPSRLDDLLDEALSHPESFRQHESWLRAERMRVLFRWREDRAAHGRSINEIEYRLLVRQHVYERENPACSPAPFANEALHGAIYGYALEQINRAGARPCYFGLDGASLNLLEDLTSLLELGLELDVRGLGSTIAPGSDALTLTVLHAFDPILKERCRLILGRLHRHIRERIEQWH